MKEFVLNQRNWVMLPQLTDLTDSVDNDGQAFFRIAVFFFFGGSITAADFAGTMPGIFAR